MSALKLLPYSMIEMGELRIEAGELREEPDNLNFDNATFIGDDGWEEFEICPTCHNFVLEPAMVEGVGKSLVEGKRYANEDCEFNRL